MYQLGLTLFEMTKLGMAEGELRDYRIPSLLNESSGFVYQSIRVLQQESLGTLGRKWLTKARDLLRDIETWRRELPELQE